MNTSTPCCYRQKSLYEGGRGVLLHPPTVCPRRRLSQTPRAKPTPTSEGRRVQDKEEDGRSPLDLTDRHSKCFLCSTRTVWYPASFGLFSSVCFLVPTRKTRHWTQRTPPSPRCSVVFSFCFFNLSPRAPPPSECPSSCQSTTGRVLGTHGGFILCLPS